MDKITKFEYEGDKISFEFTDGNRMINANEMVKPFGKRVSNFLRLKETKEYVTLLKKRYSDPSYGSNRQALRVVKGGTPELQGTWMDEKLALKFAAWLSPKFELWVYDKIYELLTTGKTELQDLSPVVNITEGLKRVIEHLGEHGQEIQKIQMSIEHIEEFVSDLEAKITSIDENYYSISGYCALNKIDCPLNKAQTWGHSATKLSNQQNIAIGKAYDAKYGNVNTYHIDILQQVIK